ncbi:hypothetical protein MTBBW1_2250009 [Desulfamplus magnetovallimortis]|uniref:Uncharacterized protein n=1 Tax=Desulfamplus magnetovallimortis TaxID=1246637 RepID=A0A1W1HDC6_9BACT|nr:hypothetical protein MTBBW1_2250009 [Desulfamplus magnetovallimortis]
MNQQILDSFMDSRLSIHYRNLNSHEFKYRASKLDFTQNLMKSHNSRATLSTYLGLCNLELEN